MRTQQLSAAIWRLPTLARSPMASRPATRKPFGERLHQAQPIAAGAVLREEDGARADRRQRRLEPPAARCEAGTVPSTRCPWSQREVPALRRRRGFGCDARKFRPRAPRYTVRSKAGRLPAASNSRPKKAASSDKRSTFGAVCLTETQLARPIASPYPAVVTSMLEVPQKRAQPSAAPWRFDRGRRSCRPDTH